MFLTLKTIVPPRTLGRPKWARMRNSRPPPSCLIFQTKADLSGAYCTVPVDAWTTCKQMSMIHGCGTHSKLWCIGVVRYWYVNLDIVCRASPLKLCLNLHHVFDPAAFVMFHLLVLSWSIYILNWKYELTAASTQTRGFTGVERRYDINSNSPSGGMKEIVRSFSNRERRTHW